MDDRHSSTVQAEGWRLQLCRPCQGPAGKVCRGRYENGSEETMEKGAECGKGTRPRAQLAHPAALCHVQPNNLRLNACTGIRSSLDRPHTGGREVRAGYPRVHGRESQAGGGATHTVCRAGRPHRERRQQVRAHRPVRRAGRAIQEGHTQTAFARPPLLLLLACRQSTDDSSLTFVIIDGLLGNFSEYAVQGPGLHSPRLPLQSVRQAGAWDGAGPPASHQATIRPRTRFSCALPCARRADCCSRADRRRRSRSGRTARTRRTSRSSTRST